MKALLSWLRLQCYCWENQSHSDSFLYDLFFSPWRFQALSLSSTFSSFTATGLDVCVFSSIVLGSWWALSTWKLPIFLFRGYFLISFITPPRTSDIIWCLSESPVWTLDFLNWSSNFLHFSLLFSIFLFCFLEDFLYFIFQLFYWFSLPHFCDQELSSRLRALLLFFECSLCKACCSCSRVARSSLISLAILIMFTMFPFSV